MQQLEELYEAFQKVPAPKDIFGCPCCVDRKLVNRLKSCIPRNLKEPDLKIFAWKVLTTIQFPSDDNIRYFAPRLIQYEYEDNAHGLHIVFGKFERANFRTWPEPQRKAVENYIAAFCEACLGNGDNWQVIDTLHEAHKIFDDIGFLLSILDAGLENSQIAVTQILEDYADIVWGNEVKREPHPQFKSWLERQKCRDHLMDLWSGRST